MYEIMNWAKTMKMLVLRSQAEAERVTGNAIWLFTKRLERNGALIVTDIRCRYAISDMPIDYMQAPTHERRALVNAIGWAKAFAATHGIEDIYTVHPHPGEDPDYRPPTHVADLSDAIPSAA